VHNQRSGSVSEAAVEFQTRASIPILDAGMNSTSARLLWSADTLAFTTAVIGLDSSNPGQPAGTTPTTSTSTTWTADITCTTRTIPTLALRSRS